MASAQDLLSRRAQWMAVHDRRIRKIPQVSIISNDCWGGEAYRLLGRPYNSPFVGLFVMGPCYVKIVSNLSAAMASPLVKLNQSRYLDSAPDYPLGLLEAVDAELHFLHYPTFESARDKWGRRSGRVDFSRLFIKTSIDKDHFSDSQVDAVLAVPIGHKLVVGDRGVAGYPSSTGPWIQSAVDEFRAHARTFDYVNWLLGGDGVVAPHKRLQRMLAYGGWQ